MFIYSFRQWLLSFVHRMATYVLSSSSQIGLLCYGRGMLVCRPRKHGTNWNDRCSILAVFMGLQRLARASQKRTPLVSLACSGFAWSFGKWFVNLTTRWCLAAMQITGKSSPAPLRS